MNRLFVAALLFFLCCCLYGCMAHETKLTNMPTEEETARITAPSGWRYVWTDSAIAVRKGLKPLSKSDRYGYGDNWIRPEYQPGIEIWHGGVFVIPGTPDSVLSKAGFLNATRKQSSAMYDYYQASWPTTLDLNSVPLSIREVRYHTDQVYWHDDREYQKTVNGESYLAGGLLTIPNLPVEFLEAYGMFEARLIYHFDCFDVYFVYWPTSHGFGRVENTPPEFLSDGSPPLGEFITRNDSLRMKRSVLPQPSSNDPGITGHDGKKWIDGRAYVESPQDTALLRRLGISLWGNLSFDSGFKRYEAWISWPIDLKLDSLPPQIKGILYIPPVKIGY